ncbi:unnamed protein product [Clavelina lepadiformis]|uniref:Amino acid transporter transmembrane domain-containing protein n=1 Tax=Clavelina lepadiformis TaxID=159417 RepID=A0ABP0FZI6_CLALP
MDDNRDDLVLDIRPEDEEDENLMNSQVPLTPNTDENLHPKNHFKDRRSFALSVFNLMNAILGSGILGLGEAAKNLGLVMFVVLLTATALLAAYTINMLLHATEMTKEKTYEGLAKATFGLRAKVLVSILIVFHCFGAICSYIYIVKNELPEVLKALTDYKEIEGQASPFYLNGDFLVILIVVCIVLPLACMKDIRFLGYSSALGLTCMLLFVFTVVLKKFEIPCPLPIFNRDQYLTNTLDNSSFPDEDFEEQTCEAKAFFLSTRSAYAVPTMFFSFMCHASMVPIYAELRRPSIKKMQKIACISIFNVYTLYLLAAIFGYTTFYNKTLSELLLTYSFYKSRDVLIILSRMMVIVCVTLSIPLLHYVGRKTIIITFFRKSNSFSWTKHIGVMIGLLTVAVVLVMFIPNIRDIFGMSGASTSTPLLVIIPSAFFIKLTGKDAKLHIQSKFATRRKVAWFLAVLGTALMLFSMALIIWDWAA